MRTTIKHIATGAAIAGLLALPVVATAANDSGIGETVAVETVADEAENTEAASDATEAEPGVGEGAQDSDAPEVDGAQAETQDEDAQAEESKESESEEADAAERIVVAVVDRDVHFLLRADAKSRAVEALDALEADTPMGFDAFSALVEADADGVAQAYGEEGGIRPLPEGIRDVTFRFPEADRTVQVAFPTKSWARLVPIRVDGTETTSCLNITRSTVGRIEAELGIDATLTPAQFTQLLDRLAEDFGILDSTVDGVDLLAALAVSGIHVVDFSVGNEVKVEVPGPSASAAPSASPATSDTGLLGGSNAADNAQGLQTAQSLDVQTVDPVQGTDAAAAVDSVEQSAEIVLPVQAKALATSRYVAVTASGVIRGSNGWPTTQRPYVSQPQPVGSMAAAPAQEAAKELAAPEAAERPHVMLPNSGTSAALEKADAVVNAMLEALPKAAQPEQKAQAEEAEKEAPSTESAIASSSSRAALFSVGGAAGVGLVLAGTFIAIRRVR